MNCFYTAPLESLLPAVLSFLSTEIKDKDSKLHIYLLVSHSFIRQSCDPDTNKCSSVLDQSTLETHPAWDVYVPFISEKERNLIRIFLIPKLNKKVNVGYTKILSSSEEKIHRAGLDLQLKAYYGICRPSQEKERAH